MKIKGLILAATLMTGTASSLSAASLTWDSTGTTPAAPGNASGAWNTTTLNWSDGSTDAAWVNANNDTAVFGGGTTTGTPGTVTLGTGITAGGLTFGTTGFTLAGNTLTLAGTTPTITTGTGVTATVNSVIAGSAGLTTAGTGTLVLGGANTFTGGVNISAGTLIVSNAAGIGNNAVTLSGTSTLQGPATYPSATFGNGTITVNAGATAVIAQTVASNAVTANTYVISGATTFRSDATIGGNYFGWYNATYGIQGSGAITLLSTQGGYLYWSLNGNGTNKYTGAITIADNSKVSMFNNSNFGTAAVTMGMNTTLGLYSTGGTVNDLTSSASTAVVNTSHNGNNAFTINSVNGSTFAGSIQGGGSLTKTGTGTLILTGASNLTGGITISAGKLVVNNATGLGSGAGAVKVNVSGTTLQIGDGTGSSVNNVTLGSGAILTVADGATLRLGGLNALSLSNTGTASTTAVITLAGAGTYNFGATGTGILDLGGVLNGLTAGAYKYTLVSAGTLSGNDLTHFDASGYDSTVTNLSFSNGVLSFTAVPEPSTYGLLGAGALAGMAFVRRRRRRLVAARA